MNASPLQDHRAGEPALERVTTNNRAVDVFRDPLVEIVRGSTGSPRTGRHVHHERVHKFTNNGLDGIE